MKKLLGSVAYSSLMVSLLTIHNANASDAKDELLHMPPGGSHASPYSATAGENNPATPVGSPPSEVNEIRPGELSIDPQENEVGPIIVIDNEVTLVDKEDDGVSSITILPSRPGDDPGGPGGPGGPGDPGDPEDPPEDPPSGPPKTPEEPPEDPPGEPPKVPGEPPEDPPGEPPKVPGEPPKVPGEPPKIPGEPPRGPGEINEVQEVNELGQINEVQEINELNERERLNEIAELDKDDDKGIIGRFLPVFRPTVSVVAIGTTRFTEGETNLTAQNAPNVVSRRGENTDTFDQQNLGLEVSLYPFGTGIFVRGSAATGTGGTQSTNVFNNAYFFEQKAPDFTGGLSVGLTSPTLPYDSADPNTGFRVSTFAGVEVVDQEFAGRFQSGTTLVVNNQSKTLVNPTIGVEVEVDIPGTATNLAEMPLIFLKARAAFIHEEEIFADVPGTGAAVKKPGQGYGAAGIGVGVRF